MDYRPLGLRDLFIADRRRLNRRESTLAWYSYAITRYMEAAGVADVRHLKRAHEERWLDDMAARGLKPGGRRTYQSALHGWLRWLHKRGYIREDIRCEMLTVRDVDRTRRTADRKDVDRMVTCALARAEHAKRNAAIIETLWCTGVRRSELAMVAFEGVDLDAGTLAVPDSKMGKARIVGLGAEARYAIHAYVLEARGEQPGPLFIGREGRALASDAIRKMLESVCASAGVHVTAHDFRRACAANMLGDGVGLDMVMHQLGHDSPAMSLLYGQEGRARRSVAAYHEWDQGIRKLPKRAG